MDEKTPHLHMVFVPLTEDNRLCAKEIIGNRASLTKVAGQFSRLYSRKTPRLGAWGERQQVRQKAYPQTAVQAGSQPLQTGKGD